MAEQYPQMPSAFYGQKPVALMNFNNVQTTTVQSKSAQHNQRLKAKSANSKSRKPINDSSISDYSNSNNFVQQIPPTKSQLNYSTSRGIPNNYSGDHLVGLNGPENMTREGSARLERDPKGQGSGQFAEYHKFTWGISPNSSITSGSCHQALRKELERAEDLLNQSIERYRSLTSEDNHENAIKLDDMKMKTRTKEAIRNEFRAMLEEHDSCATSINSINSNSPPPTNVYNNQSSSSRSPEKEPRTPEDDNDESSGVVIELKCPLCNLRVSTSLFTPIVLLPCQHVICEVCADLSSSSVSRPNITSTPAAPVASGSRASSSSNPPLKQCPVCSAVVVAAEKLTQFGVNRQETTQAEPNCIGDDNNSTTGASLADASLSSMATVLTTDSDHSGSVLVEPRMTEAEQLFFIRETKFRKQMGKLQVQKEQILEAAQSVARQLESIETEESKVEQEIKILEEKLHHLRILKNEHRKTLEGLIQKEDKINVKQFLIQRSLDSIEFQRLEHEIVRNNKL